jgi:hypothetical protein
MNQLKLSLGIYIASLRDFRQNPHSKSEKNQKDFTKMKRLQNLVILLFINLFCSSSLQAKTNPFGLGVMVGFPTGLTTKYWFDAIHAVDATVAWNHDGENSWAIQSDYLLHQQAFWKLENWSVNLYYGAGVQFSSSIVKKKQTTEVALRAPVGLNHFFQRNRVEIFVEIAPGLKIVPGTEFFFYPGIGARYFF